ncbi:MAG: hypothetical protein IJX84_04010 [Clostridia bacterium]|nr:hypothetical protein [Clostridia bacterium]
MRTTSTVHSPEERLAQRELGERLALRSQWRLLACVSILRTAVTRIMPLAGAAAWWMTLVCLLPGLVLYWLGCLGLRISKAASLPECARLALGKVGAGVVCGLAAAALAVDAVSTITALITLFTEGVGTQGTQWTLALAATGLLLFALNGEALARGVYFLRVPLLVLLGAVLVGLASGAKLDHLFPVLGGGASGLWAAFQAGAGMGWVFLLPLLQAPTREKRWHEPLPPMGLCIVALLCLNLALPHELLANQSALGDCLVLTVAHLPAFVRLVAVCLWVVALFLSLGSGVSLCAGQLLAPTGRKIAWLPGVLALAVATTQLMDIRWLWTQLGAMGMWLLVALGVGAGVSLLACGRKRK